MTDRRITLVVFALSAALYGGYIAGQSDNQARWLRYDPGWQVAAVVSLASDGDLDLRNQLGNDPARAEDQTSRGKRGEWYPLHEPLMPILALPFYLAIGVGGCLVFNFLLCALIPTVVYTQCARLTRSSTAVLAAMLTGCSPLFFEYSYSFSLDMFGALLLCIAYACAVSGHPLGTGAAIGAAVLGRFSNAVALPAFMLTPWLLAERNVYLARRAPLSSCMLIIAGGLPFALALLHWNHALYGSAIETGYHHWQRWNGTALVLSSQGSAFSRPIGEGLAGALFPLKNGIIATIPLLPFVLAGLLPFSRRARGECLFLLLLAVSFVLLVAKYDLTYPGAIGNRYLLQTAALSAIPLAFALQRLTSTRSEEADR